MGHNSTHPLCARHRLAEQHFALARVHLSGPVPPVSKPPPSSNGRACVARTPQAVTRLCCAVLCCAALRCAATTAHADFRMQRAPKTATGQGQAQQKDARRMRMLIMLDHAATAAVQQLRTRVRRSRGRVSESCGPLLDDLCPLRPAPLAIVRRVRGRSRTHCGVAPRIREALCRAWDTTSRVIYLVALRWSRSLEYGQGFACAIRKTW